ncbi:MAG: hypothetical protein C5B49_05140 [Bdellovibrio sp.]|nr:MAG: hypothetical protein C5B49_05140 [Bdellovibrio sp.]
MNSRMIPGSQLSTSKNFIMTSALDKLSFTKKRNFKPTWKTQIEDFLESSTLPSQERGLEESRWETVAELLEFLQTDRTSPLLYFSFFGELFYFDPNSHCLFALKTDYGRNVGIGPFSIEGQLLQALEPFLFSDRESYLQLDLPELFCDSWFEGISQCGRLLVAIPGADEFSLPSMSGAHYKHLHYEEQVLRFVPTMKLEQEQEKEKENEQGQLQCWGEFKSESDLNIDLWQIKKIIGQTLLAQDGLLFRFATPANRLPGNRNFNELALWAKFLLQKGKFSVPAPEMGDFFVFFINKWGMFDWKLPGVPRLTLKSSTPQPLLYLKTLSKEFVPHSKIEAQVWFRYSHVEIPDFRHQSTRRRLALDFESDAVGHTVFLIDQEAEDHFTRDELQKLEAVKFDLHRSIFKIPFENVHDAISSLLEKNWEVWAENIQVKLLNDYVMRVSANGSSFCAEFENTQKGLQFESWQIIHILKKKSAFVRLDDGTLGVLPRTWLDQLQQLYRRCLDDENPFFEAADWFSSSWDRPEEESIPAFGDQKFESILDRFRDFSGGGSQDILLEPSPHFNGELYPHQKEGLSWLVFLNELKLGGLLADEMGLGKTVQILAFLDLLKYTSPEEESSQPVTTLIITPKSLISQWVESVQKFTPQLKVALWSQHEQVHADIVLATYGVVRRHISNFARLAFHRVILDEAQLIKNENSKLSRSVKALQASHRVALTGTPIENHFNDLLSIFTFLNPGLLRWNDFALASPPPEGQNFSEQNFSQWSEDRFKAQFKKLKPLILRRKKKNVIQNLPEKFEETLRIQLAPEQEQIYNQIKSYYADQLQNIRSEEEFNEHRLFFLEGLLRLRQVCCHPQMIYKPEDTRIPLNSGKLQYLLEDLPKRLTSNNGKILVFSQFVSFLKIIRKDLETRNIPFSYLDGQTQKREQIIEEFQNQSEIRIFLLGLKVGGVGLNLTSANFCFLMDPWWNPAVESQAIDRMHRIGQNKSVHVLRLISENTIEEKIIELHKLKAKYAEVVFDTEADFLKNLTRDDFTNLFR